MSGDLLVEVELYDSTWEKQIRIVRADPEVAVAGEILRKLEDRGWAGEGLLMVKAENGTVRYALQEYDVRRDQWTARRIGPSPVQQP